MTQNIYEKLAGRLNQFDYPPKAVGDTYSGILQTMYTREEAEIAADFPEGMHTVRALAAKFNRNEEELTEILESMGRKGTIFTSRSASSERVYQLMPFLPGAYEYKIKQYKNNPEELKKLLYNVGKLDKETRELLKKQAAENPRMTHPLPGFRTLTLNEGIEGKKEVLTFENALELIDQQTSISGMPCPCRTVVAPVIYGPCKTVGIPELSCFSFGRVADYMIEQKYAKRITKDECKELVRLCNKAGLVQNTNNFTDELQFLCNCCSCCCGVLKPASILGPKIGGVDSFIGKSNFAPVRDVEKCIGCGSCVQRCPLKAISLQDGIAVTDMKLCIGCGQCQIACPVESISMIRISATNLKLGNRKIGYGH